MIATRRQPIVANGSSRPADARRGRSWLLRLLAFTLGSGAGDCLAQCTFARPGISRPVRHLLHGRDVCGVAYRLVPALVMLILGGLLGSYFFIDPVGSFLVNRAAPDRASAIQRCGARGDRSHRTADKEPHQGPPRRAIAAQQAVGCGDRESSRGNSHSHTWPRLASCRHRSLTS